VQAVQDAPGALAVGKEGKEKQEVAHSVFGVKVAVAMGNWEI